MDKSELRREMKARLSALSGEERRRASEKICMALSSRPEFIAAKKAFLFYPLKSEPDILPLVKFCEEGGKIVAYPKVEGEKMRFFASDGFIKSRLGVYEPAGGDEVSEDGETVAVVPALAYRRDGYRLGRGGGYYDRFLASFRGVSVGVGFGFSLLPSDVFKEEKHDIPVDVIVTDGEIIRNYRRCDRIFGNL